MFGEGQRQGTDDIGKTARLHEGEALGSNEKAAHVQSPITLTRRERRLGRHDGSPMLSLPRT
jgi:hypothetical protein